MSSSRKGKKINRKSALNHSNPQPHSALQNLPYLLPPVCVPPFFALALAPAPSPLRARAEDLPCPRRSLPPASLLTRHRSLSSPSHPPIAVALGIVCHGRRRHRPRSWHRTLRPPSPFSASPQFAWASGAKPAATQSARASSARYPATKRTSSAPAGCNAAS